MKVGCLVVLIINLLGLSAKSQNDTSKWSLSPMVGVSSSKLKWSIAGNIHGEYPNILSEVTWSELKGSCFSINLKYKLNKKIYIEIDNYYSITYKGNVSDVDYASNNRQNAFSDVNLDASNGNLLNANFRLGYLLKRYKRIHVHSIIGLNYHNQKYRLKETINNPRTKGVNSTYNARYIGFDVGLKVAYAFKPITIGISTLVGSYGYLAKANWNLVEQFAKPVSFTHKANASKIEPDFDLTIPIVAKMELKVTFQFLYVNTKKGIDKSYFVSGQSEETQFNGATFVSKGASVGIKYAF